MGYRDLTSTKKLKGFENFLMILSKFTFRHIFGKCDKIVGGGMVLIFKINI